jgi:dipeptidyl aminopeptidase/acylaminoacyl peptidase
MKTRVTTEDFFSIVSVSDPHISSRGNDILFVGTNSDKEDNDYKSNIYRVDGNEETIKLTSDDCSTMPRWTSDGEKFLYISKRSGKNQLYISTLNSDEPEQCIEFHGDVGFPSWSPDDTKIVFIGTIVEKKDPLEPMVLNTLKIKSDGEMGFIDKTKKRQLYVVDTASETIRQITPDDFYLYNPEWNKLTTPQWSPDGEKIVFVSQVQDDQDRDRNPYKADVFVVESTGGIPKRIKKEDGPAIKARWNDAGNAILFIGSCNEYFRTTTLKLFKYDLVTDSTKVLSNDFDRTLEDFTVGDTTSGYSDTYVKESKNGEYIYFIASDKGAVSIFRLCVKTNDISKVVGGKRRIYGFDLCKSNNTLVFAYETSSNPGEVAIFNVDTQEEKIITKMNYQFENERFLSVPESFTHMTRDGLEQEGFIMKPIGFKEDKKYPCILEIHGGPYFQYGYTMMLEFQLLAARGYVVIFCNPRGSRGYGQELSFAQINNYGTRDYEDIMLFVDEAIKCGYIDTERLGIAGGSYGGYMTNWIACQTNRFRVGVTQRCISNLISKYATSDTGYFSVEQMYTGIKRPNFKKMWDISPLKYVENIKMPLLIIHSEKDMRCPIGQGEELYTALKLQGNDTTMIRFPESNHGLSRKGIPSLRVYRLNSILDYFDKYIKKNECDYEL